MSRDLHAQGGFKGRPSGTDSGVGLLPILAISDRATIAYEVIARPPLPLDPVALARCAMDMAQQSSPAVLFVPFPGHLLTGADFRPAELAQQLGVLPSEFAWILPPIPPDPTDVADGGAAELQASGFGVALEADAWPRHGHARIIAVRPNYLLLGADYVARLNESLTTRAEVAGLISFAARLGMRLIARGVNDQITANTLTALGVQFGSGSHMSPALVLDPALATPGDQVVGPSWFRQHEPRRLEEPGRAAVALTQVTHLAAPATEGPPDGVFAEALGEMARRLQAEHDPARILQVLTDLLPAMMPMSALAVFEADWDTDTLIPRVVAGGDIEAMRDQPIPMSQGITGWAFMRGLPYNCDNTIAHPAAGTVPGTENNASAESLLVIPLVAGDQRIGVLDVWRTTINGFTTRDLDQCVLVAHLTAAAWHNAQLYRQLEDRSRTDSLTGLHNLRWWDEVAPQEAARSLRSGAHIGVLLLDLDHFKLVNDSGGHAAGDRALKDVARVLRSSVRTGDDVVRFGGEEFLILLHESGTEGALRVAESVRHAVASMPTAAGTTVTASIGVAVFPLNGPSLDDAVRAADVAMYRAKADGRNRVVAAFGQ
jgi:diguanylate cyclase (GGDEF)-like protein